MSRSTIITRLGAPSACGTWKAEHSRTRKTPYSSVWWISSALTTSPAIARYQRVLGVLEGPPVGVDGLSLPLPGLRDPFEWLGLPAAEGGQQRLVGVQDAAALLDDRDAVVEVRHHQVELLGPDRQHGLGLLELGDGVSDLPPAQADRHAQHHQHDNEHLGDRGATHGIVDRGDRSVASTIVSQTPVAPVSRQATAVTTGLKRTATHTMVSVSMKVVGVSGWSTKPNP